MRPIHCLVIATALSSTLICGTAPVLSSTPDYEKAMVKGLGQLKKKDYEGAVASFTQVLRQNANMYEAYLNRASARMEIKDYDGALSDFDQAIKVNPNVEESYIKRGDLNTLQGNHEAAIDDYTQALRLNPKNGTAHLKRASALKQNGDFAKAAEDYSSALKFDSKSIEAREDRAECRMRSYDYSGAIEDYDFLLKKFKNKATEFHFKLGELYMRKGDEGAAKDHLNQVIAAYAKTIGKGKKPGWDYIQRGLAYNYLGEKDKAMSDIERGAQLLSSDAGAQYQLGHLRLEKGDTQGAIKALDEALRINPKLNSARIERASAYVSRGDFMQAKLDLDIALAAEKDADGFLSRAMARMSFGDSLGAVNDAEDAKKLNPKCIEQRQKVVSATLTEQEKTGDKGLALAQTLEQLALFDLVENNADSAESLIKRAITIQEKSLSQSDPKIAYSLLLLGRVYVQKRQLPEAEALFRSAMTRLRTNPSGTQKYAVFNLEDCARILMQAANQEDAGAILAETRVARAVTGLSELAFTGDLSKRAEQAIEAYRQKKKLDRQEDIVRRVAATRSDPVVSEEEAPAAEPRKRVIDKPIRDKWAVIVGIGQFKDSKINLKYAAKDAKDFYNFLIKEKNFAPDHVQLLTDQTATRANILSLMGSKWLPRVAEPDDLVLIYFSSHGSPSSLDVGGVNYLVAHDTDVNDLYATGIAMQDLARIIKARVHCDRIVVLLDACHSGVAAPSTKGLVKEGNVNVDQVVQGTGQLVLSSSSPDQRSWESTRYQGSVFTKHLIDGLRKNGQMTKLGDAYKYLDEETKREVLRDRGVLQSPIMKSKWEGRDLMIGVPPAAPSHGLTDLELPDSGKSPADSEEKRKPAKSKGASKGAR